MMKLLAIGFGGFLGSILRYVIGKSVDGKINTPFPWGTLTVNLVGSFIIGFVYMLAIRKAGGITENWRLFLGAGFCGGFTTFSAFAWENVSLFDQKLMGTSLIYIISSVVFGILAVVAGGWVSRFL